MNDDTVRNQVAEGASPHKGGEKFRNTSDPPNTPQGRQYDEQCCGQPRIIGGYPLFATGAVRNFPPVANDRAIVRFSRTFFPFWSSTTLQTTHPLGRFRRIRVTRRWMDAQSLRRSTHSTPKNKKSERDDSLSLARREPHKGREGATVCQSIVSDVTKLRTGLILLYRIVYNA